MAHLQRAAWAGCVLSLRGKQLWVLSRSQAFVPCKGGELSVGEGCSAVELLGYCLKSFRNVLMMTWGIAGGMRVGVGKKHSSHTVLLSSPFVHLWWAQMKWIRLLFSVAFYFFKPLVVVSCWEAWDCLWKEVCAKPEHTRRGWWGSCHGADPWAHQEWWLSEVWRRFHSLKWNPSFRNSLLWKKNVLREPNLSSFLCSCWVRDVEDVW